MKKFLILCSVFFVAVSLWSCSKSDDSPSVPTPADKQKYLTTNQWVAKKFTIGISSSNPLLQAALSQEGASLIDVLSDREACAKDDYILFKADKKIYSYDAGVTCNPASSPESQEGTWNMNNEATKMDIIIEGLQEELVGLGAGFGLDVSGLFIKAFTGMTINTLTAQELKVSSNNTENFTIPTLGTAPLTVVVDMELQKR